MAHEDLCMLGVGLRTDVPAANYLMEKDLLGTRYMALCYDENDLDQQRMHLDTYFNILNDTEAIVIDSDEVKKKLKNIDRKVYYFDSNKEDFQNSIDLILDDQIIDFGFQYKFQKEKHIL